MVCDSSGILNLQLSEPYSLPPDVIRLEKEEYGGTVSVNLMPCSQAFLLRADANEAGTGHHPKNIIEIDTDVSCAICIISMMETRWKYIAVY